MLLVAAGLSVATGLLFGLFPAIHSTRPNLVDRAEGQCGPTFRRKGGRPFPRHARDGANRAVDGAARRCRPVREESLEHHARRSGTKDRTSCRLRRCAESQRLSAGAQPRDFWAHRRTAAPAARSDGRHLFHGSSGFGRRLGNNFTVEGFPADPDTDTLAMYTYVGSDYLRTLGGTLRSGREITERRHPQRAQGGGRQRSIRQEVQSRSRRGRQAHPPRTRNGARYRDCRRIGQHDL